MRRNPRHRPLMLLALAGLLAGSHAQAQLALPVSPSVQAPLPAPLGKLRDAVQDTTDRTLDQVTRLREARIRDLVRRHREFVDLDPAGAPVVRAEIVAIDPEPAILPLLESAGFGIGGGVTLDDLGLRMVRLHAPDGLSTREALALARRLAPAGSYDYNHLYLPASSGPSRGLPVATRAAAVAPRGLIRVGLIDSAPDPRHPALSGTEVRAWGCSGRRLPDAHGTAVASLLAGGAAARTAPRSVLFAADVYCGAPTGGAAVDVARALAWMAREGVGVVNVSLVGPPNAVLERAVLGMVERGHLVVAAVGNDGPAAAPLYPASYRGVVGVSAVNARKRVLPESGRGPQVDFAAPGADMVAAAPGGRWASVRGTSYAAPLVARLAAGSLSAPDPAAAGATLSALARLAIPASGPAEAYGRGVLGSELRRDRPPPAP